MLGGIKKILATILVSLSLRRILRRLAMWLDGLVQKSGIGNFVAQSAEKEIASAGSNVIGLIRLDTPLGCREFLKGLRIGPNNSPIVFFTEALSDKKIPIDDASDDQAMDLANALGDAIRTRKIKQWNLER